MISEHVTVTPVGTQRELHGTLRATDSRSILRLALQRPLSDGTEVRIHVGAKYTTTGRVLYSSPRGSCHHITIQQDERRQERRIAVAQTARIVSLQPQLAPIDCRAWVVDVSKTGLGLKTAVHIPCDLLLKVVIDSAIIFGEVRHCSIVSNARASFKVGVEIRCVLFRDNRKTNRRFSPTVLWSSLALALRTLLARRPQ